MKERNYLIFYSLSHYKVTVFRAFLIIYTGLLLFCWNGAAYAARTPNGLEDAFWELLNRFRESPLTAVESLGIDIEPWQRVYLETSLPPLAWNQAVHDALCEHVEDMLHVGYYSVESPDGMTLVSRLHQKGYSPLYVDTTLGLFAFRTVVSEITVFEFLLKNIIGEELRYLGQQSPKLLNRNFRDIGICIQPAQLDSIVGYPVNGYICALLFSTNADDNRPRMVGRIYEDENGNGVWDFGEGTEGVTVRFKGEGINTESPVLSEEGIYAVAGDPGMYSLEIWKSEERLFQGVGYVLRDHNIRVDVVIEGH